MAQGSAAAKVALITYSEFKCPFCGSFARDTLPSLVKKYIETGRVLLVFRHFPLDGLHPFARRAAYAAECARQQGKFNALHDQMFSDQSQLDSERLQAYVASLKLNQQRFEACMTSDAIQKVEADVRSGRELGVTGTPTFFIGSIQPGNKVKLLQRLSGARRPQDFEAALDRWLSESEQGSPGAGIANGGDR